MSDVLDRPVKEAARNSLPPQHVRKRKWIYAAVAALLVVVIGVAAYPKVKEEIAYVRGIEAYVYGFPLVIMDLTFGAITAVPKAGEYYAPYNQFFRMRTFVDPDYKVVVRISRNSLWSVALLDLDKEPIVISHPDTKGRYVVYQILNMWTDVFGSEGSRTTGTGAGHFLVAGPKWNGSAPRTLRMYTEAPRAMRRLWCRWLPKGRKSSRK